MPSTLHQGSRRLVFRLQAIRVDFTPEAASEKVAILRSLADTKIRAPYLLIRLHQTLCYLRAFPDNAGVFRLATSLLDDFEERVARLGPAAPALAGTGIAGTCVRYIYSYEVARRLAARCGGHIDIDWAAYEDAEQLDRILEQCLAHAEEPSFEEGDITTKDWIHRAKGARAVTDLDWLMAQLQGSPRLKNRADELYDTAEVPLVWELCGDASSVTHLRDANAVIRYRRRGLRHPVSSPVSMIRRRLAGVHKLSPTRGRQMIGIAVAMLAARQREVYSFNHGNPSEVYVAPLGAGTQLVTVGVLPEWRLSIEGNYGYLILSNGVPIGYGGVSPLFHQANTGINILEEYRHSEASFLFAQALRVFHTLFGSKHYIANPYQFGEGNSEAIRSGAFWFYYRFGFRPVDAAIARQARTEFARITKRRNYRSDAKTLRALSRCDLVLTLPGARRGSLFPEAWLPICATACTCLIAEQSPLLRDRSIANIVRDVAGKLGVRSTSRWPAEQQRSFDRMALLAGLVRNIDQWDADEKRALVQLFRAKGAPCERDYVIRLQAHDRFRIALADCAKRCKGA